MNKNVGLIFFDGAVLIIAAITPPLHEFWYENILTHYLVCIINSEASQNCCTSICYTNHLNIMSIILQFLGMDVDISAELTFTWELMKYFNYLVNKLLIWIFIHLFPQSSECYVHWLTNLYQISNFLSLVNTMLQAYFMRSLQIKYKWFSNPLGKLYIRWILNWTSA